MSRIKAITWLRGTAVKTEEVSGIVKEGNTERRGQVYKRERSKIFKEKNKERGNMTKKDKRKGNLYFNIYPDIFRVCIFKPKKPSYVSFKRKVNYFCMYPLPFVTIAYVLEAPFTGGGEWVCKIIRLLCSALQLNADGFTCKLVLHKNLKCILDWITGLHSCGESIFVRYEQ